MSGQRAELVCPAGTMAALKSAVEAGADCVYVGFDDETNARNFPGLNFSRREMGDAAAYVHAAGRKLLIAVNSFPQAGRQEVWRRAVDDAAAIGADAVIIADVGLCDYAANTHPSLRLHLSVQASASSVDAIAFFREAFGVRRVVLPRVLTVPEIAAINTALAPMETEVFVFGGLCVMAEGRCSLSSYVTGQSPNMNGACSPASAVHYRQDGDRLTSRLGEFTINRFEKDESAGYPTLCKGRFTANGRTDYLFEEPTSLNTLEMLPRLVAAGVTAFKIEGRQRGRAYVATVVSAFRRALDALQRGDPMPDISLAAISEGGRQTTGAYDKRWR